MFLGSQFIRRKIFDYKKEARVSENQLSYKNKLVDEWVSLNIQRVELNITQQILGQNTVVYSAVYNGANTNKVNWIRQLMDNIFEISTKNENLQQKNFRLY